MWRMMDDLWDNWPSIKTYSLKLTIGRNTTNRVAMQTVICYL